MKHKKGMRPNKRVREKKVVPLKAKSVAVGSTQAAGATPPSSWPQGLAPGAV
jgi:hypothetical protein